MKQLFALLLAVSALSARAQMRREDIHTDFVLYSKRVALEKDLRERVVGRHFSLPLDSNSEDGYLSACWAVEQFLFDGPEVRRGFDHLFAGYDALGYDTKRALLEAVYAVEPNRYRKEEEALLEKEENPRLFALCAVYLYRADTGVESANALKIRMVERFPGYDTVPVLQELGSWLGRVRPQLPDIVELFAWQRNLDGKGRHRLDEEGAAGPMGKGANGPMGKGANGPTGEGAKTIYSFQRWDRDFPGLAIVQNADGSFARDGQGRLQVFEQLARSGPGLPYFLTNGNTPQGVFSITGTDISRTNFIGPTPNLQLLLPGEGKWGDYFHDTATLRGVDSIPAAEAAERYQELLPPGWRAYGPMREAWAAGAIGRTEIIAHGTTIDPEYYKGRPFYPLTPTMGCLCAKELWNPTSGHLLVSEQNNLVNAFVSTPERKGYLIVVNVDDRREPVSRAEVEGWVKRYESKNPR